MTRWAEEHAADVRVYMYLQGLAEEQLEAVNAVARASGMAIGLYRDLAVGVSEGSSYNFV